LGKEKKKQGVAEEGGFHTVNFSRNKRISGAIREVKNVRIDARVGFFYLFSLYFVAKRTDET
jgi:hypothetical protein